MSTKRRMQRHRESHKSDRAGWLRAAVLGSGDAIVSTASLMIGVSASSGSNEAVMVAGIAGLVAGAMSMAVGEYVSVSSQRDAEEADVHKEKLELETDPVHELEELTSIYQHRGLDQRLAREVAVQLTAHDPLGAHLRDELGVDPSQLARPLQAAWVSAASFATFSLVPLLAHLASPPLARVWMVAGVSLAALGALGALGAHLGGAPRLRAAMRVTLGGGLAMAVTAGVGRLMGVAVG
jgi:VIT1/CCC1 family predicted Fe2+/Mn2+ transporter